jgi:hypothetical protein
MITSFRIALQDVWEHVGVPRSSVRENTAPRRYANHVALTSSIGEPSNYSKEVSCDALMEESVVWEIVLFGGLVIYSKTTTASDLQKAGSIEIEKEA